MNSNCSGKQTMKKKITVPQWKTWSTFILHEMNEILIIKKGHKINEKFRLLKVNAAVIIRISFFFVFCWCYIQQKTKYMRAATKINNNTNQINKNKSITSRFHCWCGRYCISSTKNVINCKHNTVKLTAPQKNQRFFIVSIVLHEIFTKFHFFIAIVLF